MLTQSRWFPYSNAKRIWWMKGASAAALTVIVQFFHANVDVYGDAAVLTTYWRVDLNPPQGDPINDSRRVTIVLVKQKGEWNHLLKPGQTPIAPHGCITDSALPPSAWMRRGQGACAAAAVFVG